MDTSREKAYEMAFEQMRNRGRALFVGAVLGVAFGASEGCESLERATKLPGIHIPDPAVAAGYKSLWARLSPDDRAALVEILGRKDVVIHIVRGNLSEEESRGGASTTSRTRFSKEPCKDHPEVEGVPWNQDWDLIYDEDLAERWARKHKIRNPVDVVIYHEIFGHILVVLRNPELLKGIRDNEERKAELEEKSRETENHYRRYRPVPLPVAPKYLPEVPNP